MWRNEIAMNRSRLMTTLARTSLALALALALLPIAAEAQRPIRSYEYNPNALRLWAANYEPEGESDYWDETFATFTGEASDFDEIAVGFEYVRALGGSAERPRSGSRATRAKPPRRTGTSRTRSAIRSFTTRSSR